MRGELMYQILDLLEENTTSVADFLVAFLSSGYGASMGKIDRKYKTLQDSHQKSRLEKERRRNLQKYISKLKSEDLISENKEGVISISVHGKKKLNKWKDNKIFDKKNYKKQVGGRVIIISYDIPIAFNRERDILRNILKLLGFSLIHKSVWVGKVKLPKEFIMVAGKLKILKFIEILEVTKSGTLKEIK